MFSLLLQDGQSVTEVMGTSLLLGTETGDGGPGRRTATLDWTGGCCGPGAAPAAPPTFSCLSLQSGARRPDCSHTTSPKPAPPSSSYRNAFHPLSFHSFTLLLPSHHNIFRTNSFPFWWIKSEFHQLFVATDKLNIAAVIK